MPDRRAFGGTAGREARQRRAARHARANEARGAHRADTNAIYRWDPVGKVTVFRSKSGYTGTDIGRYHQPGSNGLTFDPSGRLVQS